MYKKTMTLSGQILAALAGTALLTTGAGAANPALSAAPLKADAQTTKVVQAANAFLNTLSAAQKKAAVFAFTDSAQRVNWSNFPQGGSSVVRKGARWGDLTPTQRTALMTLLGTVLSNDGLKMVQGQMLADDLIRATDQGPPARRTGAAASGAAPTASSTQGTAPAATTPTGTPTGSAPAGTSGTAQPPAGGTRPAVSFGSDYYFVSFVGTPSSTSPWMLQFGGHHLAINATVVGPDITLSPSLTGGEPIKVSFNNQTYTLVPQVPLEAQAAYALLKTFTAQQQAKAVVSITRTDLVLGPGQDGKTLQPEGLPGSAMNSAQKAQFLTLIKDRLGILNADDLAARMKPIEQNLDKTYFAWFGPTDAAGGAYHRVTGPTVIIEFSPQANDGDPTNHLHNMYRDPTNEYGADWTRLK